MSEEKKIYIFDTTLRDGQQTTGVNFSVSDKMTIAKSLDELGVDYIEGGWPGANPTDNDFFSRDLSFSKSKFTAFGMTRRPGRSADNDPGLNALVNSNASTICLVGKSSSFQVKSALGISEDENLLMLEDSFNYLNSKNKEAIYDAEHFFDGFKKNKEYALKCLSAAYNSSARWIVLCDTNGGTLPNEISNIIEEVKKTIPAEKLGIHAHNDTENGVANALAAINTGVRHVQGTINGLGERCGNTNLVSLIPSLVLKTNFHTNIQKKNLKILIHCFTGTKQFAFKLLDLGAYISASGVVTFKKSKDLANTFKEIPLDKILVETDSPYLAPEPLRGKPNEPSYITHTVKFLSDLKKISFEKLSNSTTQNFFKLFGKLN